MVCRVWVIGTALLLAACQPDTPAATVQKPAPTPSSSPESTPAPASASGIYTLGCASGELAISWGGRVSEPTGQNTLSLVITNKSIAGCYLFGYPNVVFKDSAGRVLPFQYSRTGDQVVTAAAPAHVDIAPGASAYVTVNKYRCDTTDLMSASDVLLTPPGQTSALGLAIADKVGIDYCGPGDPGSIVQVSPVEPTYEATWNY